MKKAYTIREIADAIGYSKPSVAKAIKELGITPVKNGNTNILTQEQAETIASHFGKSLIDDAADAPKPRTDTETVLKQYVALLENQLATKDEQLEKQNELLKQQQETINHLMDSNKALSASIAASEAQALLARPIQEQQETAQEPKKKGFWAKILGK